MSGKFGGLMGAFTALTGALGGSPAWAALECEQIVVVAQTTIKLRDEGSSLTTVMAEIERGDLRQKLDAQELNLLRQIVRLSFTSEASVNDIFEACKAGEFGPSKPKPKP
jgi:hypothetical protein